MSRDQRTRRHRTSTTFRRQNCGLDVSTDAPEPNDRNHCPSRLWNRHVDDFPGDRDAECDAAMEPVDISDRTRANGRLPPLPRLPHRHPNRIAAVTSLGVDAVWRCGLVGHAILPLHRRCLS